MIASSSATTSCWSMLAIGRLPQVLMISPAISRSVSSQVRGLLCTLAWRLMKSAATTSTVSDAVLTASRLVSRGSSPLAIAPRMPLALARASASDSQRGVADLEVDLLAVDARDQPEAFLAAGVDDELHAGHDAVGPGGATFFRRLCAFHGPLRDDLRHVRILLIAVSGITGG